MSDTFSQMLKVLNNLGQVSEGEVKLKNGKTSKFEGKLSSKVGDQEVNFGILRYDWKRSIGVDKVNQAIQQTEKAGFDGAFVIGNKFSRSAIEQAYRINESTNKRIVLFDEDEIEAAYAVNYGSDLE